MEYSRLRVAGLCFGGYAANFYPAEAKVEQALQAQLISHNPEEKQGNMLTVNGFAILVESSSKTNGIRHSFVPKLDA